jgi:chromosome segregation and condensation protein ScpB
VESGTSGRGYEFVTKAELALVRGKKLKHRDLHRAIRALREMSAGEGLKIKCSGSPAEIAKKQKAAKIIAKRAGLAVRTMVEGSWLFMEKLRDR